MSLRNSTLAPFEVVSDNFLTNGEILGFGKVFPSREELKVEQGKDATLSPLFEDAVSEEEIGTSSCGYFVNDDILMRKWAFPKMSSEDGWSSVFQIVCMGLIFYSWLMIVVLHGLWESGRLWMEC